MKTKKERRRIGLAASTSRRDLIREDGTSHAAPIYAPPIEEDDTKRSRTPKATPSLAHQTLQQTALTNRPYSSLPTVHVGERRTQKAEKYISPTRQREPKLSTQKEKINVEQTALESSSQTEKKKMIYTKKTESRLLMQKTQKTKKDTERRKQKTTKSRKRKQKKNKLYL